MLKPLPSKFFIMMAAVLSFFSLTGCDALYGQNKAGQAVRQTDDGGYILAGYTQYNRNVRPNDAFMIKIDEQGNLEWSQSLGTKSEGDYAYSVQQTGDGGYILAGRTVFQSPGFPFAILLIKTDSRGNVEWSRVFDDRNESSQADFVQQTGDGGYILAGHRRTGPGGSWVYDALLIKTDDRGNEAWSQAFGGTGSSDYAYSAQQTGDGGCILAGRTWTLGDGSAALLIKADHRGNKEWSKTFEGIERFNYVQQTRDEGYILAGTGGYLVKTDERGNEEWSQTFEGGMANSAQQTRDGGYILAGTGGYLVKTDDRGNEEWSRAFEGAGANSVQQTRDGGYILTGVTESGGVSAAWLVKTDDRGNEEWSQAFGGSAARPGILVAVALLLLPVLNFICFIFFLRDMKARSENRLSWLFKFLILGPLAVAWYKSTRKPNDAEGPPPLCLPDTRRRGLHNFTKHLILPWSIYVLILPPVFMYLLMIAENPSSHQVGEYIFWFGVMYVIAVIPFWIISTLVSVIIMLSTLPRKHSQTPP